MVQDIDKIEIIVGKTVDLATPEEDIKEKYNYLAKAFSLPYAPVRSYTKVQQSIYDWFDKYMGFKDKSRLVIQKIVLCSEENQSVFKEIIERAKFRFKSVKEQEIRAKSKTKENEKWNVPTTLYYNEMYQKVGSSRYILDPCYLAERRSDPEYQFEDKLEKSTNIAWWFKNGERKKIFWVFFTKIQLKINCRLFTLIILLNLMMAQLAFTIQKQALRLQLPILKIKRKLSISI